jgi:hypothetical protein
VPPQHEKVGQVVSLAAAWEPNALQIKLVAVLVYCFLALLVEEIELSHLFQSLLIFYSLKDLASSKPHVILSIPEAIRLTDKFEALGNSISANP